MKSRKRATKVPNVWARSRPKKRWNFRENKHFWRMVSPKRNSRKSTSFATLVFTWLSMHVIPTARDSCHVVFFHVTFLICPAHQDVIPFWFDLDVFQNHVTFLICSGGESRSIQPIELDRFLGKRVRSYCRLPRRTRLCVCQRHVTCGIKKRYSSWIRFCASKRYIWKERYWKRLYFNWLIDLEISA